MVKYIIHEFSQFKNQLPYLFLLAVPILRKTIFNRVRDMDAYNQVDGSSAIAILFTLITLALIIPNIQKLKNWNRASKPFIAYHIFAIISIAWASMSQIPVAGYKAVEVMASFLLVMFIMSKLKDVLQCFSIILVLLLCLNLLFLITEHGHNNAFPILGMAEFLLALGAIRYGIFDKSQMLHHLVIGVGTIIFSTSTATYMSLIIGLFIFYSTRKKGINIGMAIFVAVVFYVAYSLFQDEIYRIVYGHKTQAEIETGSGRQQLWVAYIKGWLESPLVGHGFIVGEKGAVASRYVAFATNTSHNMMISVLVNTGIIGMAIWLWFLWKQCAICYQFSLKKNKMALVCFPTIIAVFVNANSFPIIGSEWSPVSPPIYALISFIFYCIPLSQRNPRYHL